MGENSYSRKMQHLNVTQTSPDAPEILMTVISQLHWATYHFLEDFEAIKLAFFIILYPWNGHLNGMH